MFDRVLVFFSILSLAASVICLAGISPDNSTTNIDGVQRCYLCPDGLGDCPASDIEVCVRDNQHQPLPGVAVEIQIAGGSTNRIGLCPGQTLLNITNAQGIARFNTAGGGCYKVEGACKIWANDFTELVLLRSFDATMSSDYTGADNVGVPGMWDLLCDPRDLAAFVTAYKGGAGPASCHDYDNSGITDGPDLAVFVSCYKGGANRCD